MLRRVITATAALLVALSLAAFAGSAAYPLDVLSSFRFHLVPVAGLLVVLALVVRARWATGLALLALGINGIVVLPLYTGDQPRPAGSDRLLVAHVNMQGLDGDVAAFRRVVRRRRPDVIVVLEAPEPWRKELDGTLPGYRLFTSGRGDVGLARVPVALEPASASFGRESRPFRVRLGRGAVHVLALHTPSPITPGRADERNREL